MKVPGQPFRQKTNPIIPKPEKMEKPVTEMLVQKPETHINIPVENRYVRVPHFNDLYDSLRSKQAWRYVADFCADGTVTTIAGSQVNVPVQFDLPSGTQSPNFRLSQWPDGVQLYMLIRLFSLGPTTATFATQGAINVFYYTQAGTKVPLGVYANNAFNTNGFDTLLPDAITDPGFQNGIGQIGFTLNGGATVGSYNWMIGYSLAYMIPALKGYSYEEIGKHIKR